MQKVTWYCRSSLKHQGDNLSRFMIHGENFTALFHQTVLFSNNAKTVTRHASFKPGNKKPKTSRYILFCHDLFVQSQKYKDICPQL